MSVLQNMRLKEQELQAQFELLSQKISRLRNRGWFVLKVRVKSSELNKWLREQKLTNLHENREKFVGTKVAWFLKDSSI